MREDQKRKSEEEAGVFDEVDEFLSKKPYSKSKVVVNSSKVIHENIENCEPNEELPSFSGGSNNKTAGKFPQPNKAECLTGEL